MENYLQPNCHINLPDGEGRHKHKCRDPRGWGKRKIYPINLGICHKIRKGQVWWSISIDERTPHNNRGIYCNPRGHWRSWTQFLFRFSIYYSRKPAPKYKMQLLRNDKSSSTELQEILINGSEETNYSVEKPLLQLPCGKSYCSSMQK